MSFKEILFTAAVALVAVAVANRIPGLAGLITPAVVVAKV